MLHMSIKMYSVEELKGAQVTELGLVKGSVVQTKNVAHDIFASFKTIFGGEIESYTEMIEEARVKATNRMIAEAEEMNADAILGVRFTTSQIMEGAAEVLVFGTAVKIG
jgi:uncharacterized protein YbjQ (UPF0145 family)